MLSIACSGTLLLSSFFVGGTQVTHAAYEPIKDTITLTVRYPDTVGVDEDGNRYGTEPNDINVIADMVSSYGKKYPNRSGWSATIYECKAGKTKDQRGNWVDITYWDAINYYFTDDSRVPHSANDLKDVIIQEYGEEMYELAVKNNAVFYYDPNTEVPEEFLDPNTPIGQVNLQAGYTQGLYSVYQYDSRYYHKGHIKCNVGDFAYTYNNNEFYVTATFDVYWQDNSPQGSVDGQTYWELRRTDENKASDVAVYSQYNIPYSSHVGVRNIRHTVTAGSTTKTYTENTEKKPKRGKHSYSQPPAIEFTVNGQQVKNKTLSYSFEYEYTNKEIGWVCVSRGKYGCRRWKWDDNPDWRAVRTFRLSGSMPVDHRQGETEKWTKLDDVLNKKWIVGRKDTWNGGSKSSKTYYEQWKRASGNNVKTSYNLKTQSYLPILQGALEYQVELPSGKHKESSFDPLRKEWSYGYFFPADIDDSLKSDYRNRSEYTAYDYAFPLQQSVMKDNGLKGLNRSFTVDFTTDIFLMSENTGLIVGVPYANAVKDRVKNGQSLPSVSSYITQAASKLESRYESATGQDYRDNPVTSSASDLDEMQRYYLPINSTSDLLPGNKYKNHIVYKNMGLSDAIFEFDQTFRFDHYLFGSPKDDAWIVEQVAERINMKNLSPSQIHTIHMTNEQVKQLANLDLNRTKTRVHEFRRSDRDFVDKVKNIVDLDLD